MADTSSLHAFGNSREVERANTFANPLDLDYRFELDEPSRRSAADPVITLFRDDYYLFASRSGGYWYSADLGEWHLVIPDGLPIEDPAAAILILDDRMYYTAHRSEALYVTDDPKSGKWRKVADLENYPDPAFLLDDDGRLYLYYGAAFNGSVHVVELDPSDDFRVIDGPFKLMDANFADHGWERSGADNLGAEMSEGFRIAPWIEGPWMTKHEGTYYLQYSAPGTVWKSYADGIYTSRSPTGGFTYESYSPFSYKPGGFIGSAGHAATFRDKAGNHWRVVTMIISVAHKFERRLGIFPAGFDDDGVMRADTYLGDYPQFLPGVVPTPLDHNRTGWMLLSGGKRSNSSSTLAGHPVDLAFDEDIRTHWSALSGDPGEWLSVDLGDGVLVHAVQVNFAEQDTRAFGRAEQTYPQYVVEASSDDRQWSLLLDRSANTRDAPHDYAHLDAPMAARYLRITNLRSAAEGKFAIRDLRVFGTSKIEPSAEVDEFTVRRHDDERSATIQWEPAARAGGYVVRFGIAADKLYSNYQVGAVDRLIINSLNSGVRYYFTVDALNESGVVASGIVKDG
jgi:hypothetical protein